MSLDEEIGTTNPSTARDEVEVRRVVVLLRTMLQQLGEFIATARREIELPACLVVENDVKATALYLKRAGLGIDGDRLQDEYRGLTAEIGGFAISAYTWKQPTEGQALQHKIGEYIQPVANEAEFKRQQELYRWSAIGGASAMKCTIEGLLETMSQTNLTSRKLAPGPAPSDPKKPANENKVQGKPNKGGRPPKWAALLALSDQMKSAIPPATDKQIVATYNKKNPRAKERASPGKLRDARCHRKQTRAQDDKNSASN